MNMPSVEKQTSVLEKIAPLRGLASETNGFASNPLEDAPPKDKETIHDSAKFSGIKRQQSSSPSSPPNPNQNNASNGQLVYVRRKLETEANKACLELEGCTDFPCSRNCGKEHSTEKNSPNGQVAMVSCLLFSPASLKASLVGSEQLSNKHPGDFVTTPPANKSTLLPAHDSKILCQGEEHLKERFVRLQMFLKNSNQGSQDEYVQKLRSLSAAGRSMHAVELEKRAIQLLLDEGRELQKMKALNILGKPFP